MKHIDLQYYITEKSIKEQKQSVLDQIDGVGVKRKKELLKLFGSIEDIKKANYEEIYSVIRNKRVSKNIIDKVANL